MCVAASGLIAAGCAPIGGGIWAATKPSSSSSKKRATVTLAAPTTSGITPTVGAQQGGTVVTIDGSNFSQGTVSAFVGGVQLQSLTVLSDTQLQVVGPPARRNDRRNKRGHTQQKVDVTVTTGIGSATFAGSYTYEVSQITR